METRDVHLLCNRDWDPEYLACIFEVEFNDYSEMWCSDIDDSELICAIERVEKYSPIVEDISMDDIELCSAVEKIEEE